MNELLKPVDICRGMVSLDKEKFQKKIRLPILIVDVIILKSTLDVTKKYLLKLLNFKPVQNETGTNIKRIFFDPTKISCFNSFSVVDREKLEKIGVTESNFVYTDVDLTYDNWKAGEIINSVIPSTEMFSSYTSIGHIIQVVLKPSLLPYKELIGAVLLDKIKNCRTVVNKTDIIENTFRNFKMEIIAGSNNTTTVVKENECDFEFDFSKVYWNSRLCTEHNRIISMLKKADILYDVFCGVGPFSIPAAKKKCTVLANDLNSCSCMWLEHNIQKNNIKSNLLQVVNKDGLTFIKNDLKLHLLNCLKKKLYNEHTRIYITMNLPSIAYTFLPAFMGLLSDAESNEFPHYLLPTIHLYCFVKNEETPSVARSLVARSLVEKTLNITLSHENIEIFNVRNVAPNKEMFRVSFKLSKDILFNSASANNSMTKTCKRILTETDVEMSKNIKKQNLLF